MKMSSDRKPFPCPLTSPLKTNRKRDELVQDWMVHPNMGGGVSVHDWGPRDDLSLTWTLVCSQVRLDATFWS